ncbi:hypothetical protein K523DRAFT_376711 [Schizophyllum commune Tattone D]|nr:hypothetical protein K523DRAFT_376711 [Schizophyllum commune Tattone D]
MPSFASSLNAHFAADYDAVQIPPDPSRRGYLNSCMVTRTVALIVDIHPRRGRAIEAINSERLLCPEDDCPKDYSNVGNVNRHLRDDHGRAILEGSAPIQFKKIIVPKPTSRCRKAKGPTTAKNRRRKLAAKVNADATNRSRKARDLKKRIISPLPHLAGLVGPQDDSVDVHASDPCADSNIGHVDAAFGHGGATLHPMEGPIPLQHSALTGTAPVSSRTPQWATPPPPYPAHPAGLPDDYGWARQGLAQPAGPSEFVDEKFPSFDASQRAHFSHPLAYQPAAMVSYTPVPVANSSSAPTMGFPSAPTTAFPPVPPPQSEVFWREQIEATVLRQRQAEAFRQQQELTLQREITSAQHRMVQPPRHEQDAGMFRAQQQQVEDPWAAAMIQELQAHLTTSATTNFPTNFDHLAHQAGTSGLRQQSYASYPPPLSSDFSLHPRDRVVYEQRAPPMTQTPFFPAFDSCHFPALEPRQQITQTPFSDVHQELTGAASSALNFGDAFIPWSSFE